VFDCLALERSGQREGRGTAESARAGRGGGRNCVCVDDFPVANVLVPVDPLNVFVLRVVAYISLSRETESR